MSVNVGGVATSVGKGLFAGVVGTAAMMISSTLEMKIRVRPGSSAPAEATAKVLGVEDLATHKLPLDEVPYACEIFQKTQDGAIKVLLQP